jgi:hypothetical protein
MKRTLTALPTLAFPGNLIRCLVLCGGTFVLAGCSDSPPPRAEANEADRKAREQKDRPEAVDKGPEEKSPKASDEEALKTLNRAIEAHGGVRALEQVAKMVRVTSGVVVQGGKESAFNSTLTCDLPDRYRYDFEVGAEKTRIAWIVLKDRGYLVNGGMTQEMDPRFHEEQRQEGYVIYLTTLLPLRDKAYTLQALPEEKVRGNPAAVVRASKKGQEEARLYFDKSSGLLVQIARRSSVAGLVNSREYLYGEFKDFDGVKLPTHHVEQINGQRGVEAKSSTYTLPAQVDEKQFARP